MIELLLLIDNIDNIELIIEKSILINNNILILFKRY